MQYPYEGTGFANWSPVLKSYSEGFLVDLFQKMFRIRLIEEEIENRYFDDLMKTPIHLVIGQEATAVGACAALSNEDLLYSGHRTHGAYLGKGGDLKKMLSEMHCRINGCAGSRGGSMHLIDQNVDMAWSSAIVGGAIPIATGASLASQVSGDSNITMVFFGDGGTEEGVCSESLNFAALKKLPIIFFCENNFYSVQSPLATRQPKRDICRWAEGHGINSTAVDGTNVLEVYEATKNAVDKIKQGGGPWFIEAKVYRFRAHGGAGDDSKTGYRDVKEREMWERHCPVESYYSFLDANNIGIKDQRINMEKNIKQEIKESFEYALKSPEPEEADLFKYVYAD